MEVVWKEISTLQFSFRVVWQIFWNYEKKIGEKKQNLGDQREWKLHERKTKLSILLLCMNTRLLHVNINWKAIPKMAFVLTTHISSISLLPTQWPHPLRPTPNKS